MTAATTVTALEADLADLAAAIAGCRDPGQVRRLQMIRRSRLAELEALRRDGDGPTEHPGSQAG